MYHSIIAGTGSYLPEEVVTNRDISRMVGISPEDIYKRTGIRERRKADAKEAASDLGIFASEKALAAASVGPAEIDLILVATTSQDMFFPSTACLVQKGLGILRAPAFDIGASCSGFLFALHTADAFIKTGMARKALVIATEVKSRFVDPHDPETAFLFGDGAGAVVLSRGTGKEPVSGGRGILWTRLFTDGSRHHWIELPAGGSRSPTTPMTLRQGMHTMRLDGGRVFRAAVRGMEKTLQLALDASGHDIAQVSHFVFHQANLRILRRVAKTLEIPPEKIPMTLERYGNTSSASLPITLDETAREGKFRKGDLLYLGTFGGGLSWGGMLLRW